MCGITGIWGDCDEEIVREMMRHLAHRGPDGQGMLLQPEGPGVLGYLRLAIMDPAGGDQPIRTEEGVRAIVANGEIYNFPVLRSNLESRHPFLTNSDSEAALHLYEEQGSECARYLDGMFALAIADGKTSSSHGIRSASSPSTWVGGRVPFSSPPRSRHSSGFAMMSPNSRPARGSTRRLGSGPTTRCPTRSQRPGRWRSTSPAFARRLSRR